MPNHRTPFLIFACCVFLMTGSVAATVAAPIEQPNGMLYPLPNDTVDVGPAVFEVIESWHPGAVREFCVVSYATWPRYAYLRYVRLPGGVCLDGAVPRLIQLPVCPDSIPRRHGSARWAVVQCTAHGWMRYSRDRTPLPTATTAGGFIHPHGT